MHALRAQIRETAQQSMHDVRAQLDQAKAMLHADEESPLIAEAERLIFRSKTMRLRKITFIDSAMGKGTCLLKQVMTP